MLLIVAEPSHGSASIVFGAFYRERGLPPTYQFKMWYPALMLAHAREVGIRELRSLRYAIILL